MEKKVLIPSDISQPGKDYLAEKGYTIKMGRGTDEQTILEDVADCDALLARNEHITRAIMEAAPRLKVISKHGVGLDKIDLDAARELNIWVTNGPLSNTVAVAEHTMMLILACAKKLVFFDRAARRGDYDIRNRVKGMDLEGKTLGLLGLGKIGHMVAKKAINGFGMEVIGYDPFLPADRWDPEVGRRETMEEIRRQRHRLHPHALHPGDPQQRGPPFDRDDEAHGLFDQRGPGRPDPGGGSGGGPAERRHCRRGAGRVPNRTPQPGRSALPAAQRDGHAPQRGSDAGDHGPHGPPRRYGHRRSALRPPAFLARGGAQGAENMMRFQR